MNEHGWPGWPDDPTGGDAHDGGRHGGHESALPADATPDHGWLVDDPFDDGEPSSDGELPDGSNEQALVDAAAPDHETPDHDTAGYAPGGHDDAGHEGVADPAGTDRTMGPVGADPDALAEPDAAAPDPAGPFPPAVDVGALPDPIDGFPWIDTGSLGILPADTAAATATDATGDGATPVAGEQVSADLAAYAATDLPPGADPWAELANSDDPATSALARWWAPGQ